MKNYDKADIDKNKDIMKYLPSYFGYVNDDENHHHFVISHLMGLFYEGIIDEVDIPKYIEYENNEYEFKKKILKIFPNVIIECYYENEFEYRCIKKIWELGQTYNKRNDILLYFHSKGVTHNLSYESNKNDKYNIILKDIELIKEIFTIFPKIDKIGYSSGGIGWLWYNFWYVRGSYINQVEKPIKTNRRHYYEDYISRKVNCKNDMECLIERPFSYYENTLDTCYSFYTNKINIKNIGSYYNPNDNKYYDL